LAGTGTLGSGIDEVVGGGGAPVVAAGEAGWLGPGVVFASGGVPHAAKKEQTTIRVGINRRRAGDANISNSTFPKVRLRAIIKP
jgi:hypothetical protein